MACTGKGDNGKHCCYVAGKVCEFLEFGTIPGRNFVCGLRRELGSWDKVHADPRYQPIAKVMETEGLCGDWQPKAGICCRAG